MKAIIKKVEFIKESESKFGMMYNFKVSLNDGLNDITAYYTSKKREQDTFKEGVEAEFNLEEKEGKSGQKYYTIKPIKKFGSGNFGKALTREQSKYSGFAMSYAKDLVIADKIKLDQISEYTKKMFSLMVELDKSLLND